MVERADHEPAEHVDDEDQDAGDRVAAHELAGAVHRAVEIRFLRDLVAPCDGLLLRDEPGVQIGVDGHLLAGHRVQREPRRDLRDAPGALRHDHEVDDDENHEHDDADGVVAADHELAERLDDLPGGIRARVTVHQHDARRGDVEPEPQQRDTEQHRREHREIERPLHVDHGEQDHERQRDVEREEGVEQQRRQRHDDHREHRDDEQRHAEPEAADVRESCEHGGAHASTPRSGPRRAARLRSASIVSTGIFGGPLPWPARGPFGFGAARQLIDVREHLRDGDVQPR